MMLRLIALTAFASLVFYSCSQSQAAYTEQVGDIPATGADDPNFTVCSEWFFQYYNFDGFAFEGEKSKLAEHFKNNFNATSSISGYITIRFVVNCKGETGRFRIEQMDFDYQPAVFNASVTNQLLILTKELKGWKVQIYKDQPRDYNQYLTFKFENGQLKEIMP